MTGSSRMNLKNTKILSRIQLSCTPVSSVTKFICKTVTGGGRNHGQRKIPVMPYTTLRSSTGLKNVTTMGKEWKEKKDNWIGNYTLGGHSTLSISPDPTLLKRLYNQKGHLLEVL